MGADTFVGRDHELAVLAGIRARAVGGRRQLVVVSGEAGIGKTWFCGRATVAAERDGFDVVWGRCWPDGGAPALWPWPAMLTELIGEDGARLLAEDTGSDRIDPERFARFAAVAQRLASVRAGRPTMIVIDDVHGADGSALLLTRFLAGTLDRLPLVMLLVRRAEPAVGGTLLGELERDAMALPLRRFDLPETSALLAAYGLADADGQVAGALLQLTGGSPLFLAHAVGRGSAGRGPRTVQQAVADTVARLPAGTRRILAFAAVLGFDGTVSEIAGLAGESPATVLAALTAAADGGLIDPAPAECAFHDLVRQAALDQFETPELLDAHARAAALLTGTGHPERVAHHALAAAVRSAADTDAAIAACRDAASALRRGFGYEQATDLLGRAVALAEHHPDSPRHAELLVERADAVLTCGRLTEARAAFEEATGAAERAGDPVLLARAVLGLGGVWVHEHRNTAVR
ncbi:MAG: AAA family ATPase, partial [Pseudonocardiaceae bacterium]